MLSLLLALVLACPQSIDITPKLVHIPADKTAAGTWPNWDMTNVGYTSYTITYNSGPNGFLANGFIEVGFGYDLKDDGVTNDPHYTSNLDYIIIPNDGARVSPVDQFQISTPNAANYVTVSAPVNVTLSLIHNSHPAERMLRVTFNAVMPGNSTVTITFGDTSQGGPGALLPWNPGRPRLICFEKRNPNSTLVVTQQDFPIVLFTAQTATAFVVNAPLVVEVEQPFEFIVQAVQGRDVGPDAGMSPVEDFTGTINWSAANTTLFGSQTDRTFKRIDRGVKRYIGICHSLGFTNIAIDADGSSQVASSATTLSYSNQIKVVPTGSPDRIYVGDLQRHSCEGGHAAIPDWMCWRELYSLGDDFGTVVEHSELFFFGWQHANKIAQDVQAAHPNFVVFPGYEYGLPGAHRHVIFKTFTTDPALAAGTSASAELPPPVVAPTVTDFLNNLHNPPTPSIPRIAIIHHPLWDKSNFPNAPFEWGPDLDDSVQRLVEIYSTHGSSEVNHTNPGPFDYPIAHDAVNGERPASENASVRAALSMGYRYGIICGSDRHGYYRSQNANDDGAGPYTRAGLAFVHSLEAGLSTRDRIWNGFENRHTYGTTGSRIYLNFTANGSSVGMGDLYDGQDFPIFNIEVAAAGLALDHIPNITEVSIILDGTSVVVDFNYPGQPLVNQNWVDPNPIRDGQYHSYYVKVLQDDGQTAWSSPIWVNLSPQDH